MLNKCGLLQKGSINLVPYASKTYNTRDNDSVARGFKRTFSQECKPYFIGVWDSVGSMGWFWGRRYYDTILNEDVAFGYQAASIDEKRRKFPVSLWNEDRCHKGQTIVQVWFTGYHFDVGGNSVGGGVSDIALKWMLDNAEAKGMRLKEGWVDGINPDPCGVISESRNGFWRLWRPAIREIPEGAKIHSSVFERIDDPATQYHPSNLPNRCIKIDS